MSEFMRKRIETPGEKLRPIWVEEVILTPLQNFANDRPLSEAVGPFTHVNGRERP